MIKNTYMQLNFDMTIETENKIQNYLIKDKQRLKTSQHTYSLDEYGLNETIIKSEFRDYMLNYRFLMIKSTFLI